MGVFAVLSQALPMVGEHRDQRVCGRLLANSFEQAAQFVIGVGDLAIIRAAFVLLPKWCGWLVGCMRIIHVDPEKKWLARLRIQPADCPIHGVAGASLGVFQEFVALAGLGHLIVVYLKALVQPE